MVVTVVLSVLEAGAVCPTRTSNISLLGTSYRSEGAKIKNRLKFKKKSNNKKQLF